MALLHSISVNKVISVMGNILLLCIVGNVSHGGASISVNNVIIIV